MQLFADLCLYYLDQRWFLLSNHWAFLVFITVIAELILWLYIDAFLKLRDSRPLMIKRICAYAKLSTPQKAACSVSSDVSDCGLLSVTEHQILLGILKKVEQKNSTLIAILVFLESAFLTVYFQDGKWSVDGLIMAWAAYATLPALFASLVGIRHLDVGHLHCYFLGEHQFLEAKLQSDLLADLELKEACFKFSWYTVFGVLFVLMTLLFLRTLCQVTY